MGNAGVATNQKAGSSNLSGRATFLERRPLKNKNLVNWQPFAGECLWQGVLT